MKKLVLKLEVSAFEAEAFKTRGINNLILLSSDIDFRSIDLQLFNRRTSKIVECNLAGSRQTIFECVFKR